MYMPNYVDADAALIDPYAPQTDYTQPFTNMAANPDTDLMTVGENRPAPLPDASVGGVNGAGRQNGYSTGFRSYASRFAKFTGAMLALPAITNPVQGQVGTSARSTSTYLGVMNQLLMYTPNQADYAASYVGTVSPRNIVTGGAPN